jgi:ribokinase
LATSVDGQEQGVGRVFVAGSINMDVVASAPQHPKVGETVLGRDLFFFPGGKGANQAVAAARLGVQVSLIGRIGRDDFGAQMRGFLSAQGVDLTYVQETGGKATGCALIVVANRDNAIVVVPGANAELSMQDIGAVSVSAEDVLLSQLEIPTSTVAAFFARGRAGSARTILNPAPAIDVEPSLFALADLVILNETELAAFTGRQVDASAATGEIVEVANTLRSRADQVVCVTLGARGVAATIGGETHVIVGRQVEAVDTTGAGDCFAGAVAAELARGASILDALRFANAAASICVQRMGAGPSMPGLDEVRAVQRLAAP